MKPYLLLFLFVALLCSCLGPPVTPDTKYYPVLISRESLEKSTTFGQPEAIASPGKILFKDNFILIQEQFTGGIHVIDNTDPKNPINKGYIKLLANTDVTLKGNTLYADNAVDLLAIDLSNLGNSSISISKRIKQIFPEILPPDKNPVPDKFLVGNRPANTVIIAWEK